MRVWGVYDDEIREILAEVGLRAWNNSIKRVGPESYRLRLALGPRVDGARQFQKLSQYGYPTTYVCWHGHREFLFSLFRKFPEARVQTTLDFFAGRSDFLEYYRETKGGGNDYNVSHNWDCVCQPELARANRRARGQTNFEDRLAQMSRRRVPVASPTFRVEPVTIQIDDTVTGADSNTYQVQFTSTENIQWVPVDQNETSDGS